MRGAQPPRPDGDGEVVRASEPSPVPGRAWAWLERALDAGILASGAIVVYRLAMQTLGGRLSSDECFHAAVARWIHDHHAIPTILPQFYSGFFYYYQPLLHLIGAAWLGAFGSDSLLGLPVALAVALFLLLASGGAGATRGVAGRWAAVVAFGVLAVAIMSVRLYVETLSSLLAVATVALLIRARHSGRMRDAVALGLVAGLGLLAKFSAWTLVLGIALVAAFDAVRGGRERAVRLATAAGIALLVGLPWLIRNQVLFGSAFYPLGAPDLDPRLAALNHARFSTPPVAFLAGIPVAIGGPGLALGAAAVGLAALDRRWSLRESLMAGAALAMVGTAFVPYAAARHLGPFIIVFVWMGASSVIEGLASRPLARIAAGLAMLGLGAWSAFHVPDYRSMADPPDFLTEALPQVARHTPPDARILSLWTYDTAYWTGRAATWPNPWGQRDRPVAMFYTDNPDSILLDLRRSGITDVLTPVTVARVPFNSANYPEGFVRGLETLTLSGRLRLVWRSDALVLLTLRPGTARSDSLAPESSSPGRSE